MLEPFNVTETDLRQSCLVSDAGSNLLACGQYNFKSRSFSNYTFHVIIFLDVRCANHTIHTICKRIIDPYKKDIDEFSDEETLMLEDLKTTIDMSAKFSAKLRHNRKVKSQ